MIGEAEYDTERLYKMSHFQYPRAMCDMDQLEEEPVYKRVPRSICPRSNPSKMSDGDVSYSKLQRLINRLYPMNLEQTKL